MKSSEKAFVEFPVMTIEFPEASRKGRLIFCVPDSAQLVRLNVFNIPVFDDRSMLVNDPLSFVRMDPSTKFKLPKSKTPFISQPSTWNSFTSPLALQLEL